MAARHILIAEDDPHIRDGLQDALASEGYRVTAVSDGLAALAAVRAGGIDLALLDVMMPGKSGYDVCRDIRKTDERLPIIILTAKGEEIDKVVGLQLGADDYVTKPFSVRELLARIAAVLRRCAALPRADGALTALPAVFEFGAARIDSTTFRGTLGGRPVEFTPREMRIIEYFYERPGKVVSRESLLADVWEMDNPAGTRTLDQHIAQLRKKVEADPAHPRAITTVHGVGYRYEG
ncbi:MAG: Sensory transduction protein regX3 [Lentisphaerae bacterium ADurb.BinA184]|nr:MAG: Sensory transduction protein regX3 [Lentisphaerae bacterium ADurb.BinA184]